MAKRIELDLNKILQDTPYAGTTPRIGVALSGGRDSVALAHALKGVYENVVAVNIEHGIRGENSLRDTQFAKDFCLEHGIPFISRSVDAPKHANEYGYTLEQSARILRYEVFDRLLASGECDLIALAHHADDQTETILMRILRGTGVKGLVGMRPVNGRYIRPLLEYSREDIDAYINENHLDFVDDETNADTVYTRNYLRREIAALKQRFPNINDSFARLSRNAAECEEYISAQVPDPVFSNGEARVGVADIKSVAPAIAKRLVQKAINMLDVFQDIEEKHYPLVFELCDCENGKFIELTHGVCAHKDGSDIVFCKQTERISQEIPFDIGTFDVFGVKVEQSEMPSDFAARKAMGELYVDADKLPDDTVIRARREGDRILKFGGGSKNLGDFLTDIKYPLRHRDSVVVAASGSEIYAVFGVEISKNAKVDEHTKRIFKLSLYK